MDREEIARLFGRSIYSIESEDLETIHLSKSGSKFEIGTFVSQISSRKFHNDRFLYGTVGHSANLIVSTFNYPPVGITLGIVARYSLIHSSGAIHFAA